MVVTCHPFDVVRKGRFVQRGVLYLFLYNAFPGASSYVIFHSTVREMIGLPELSLPSSDFLARYERSDSPFLAAVSRGWEVITFSIESGPVTPVSGLLMGEAVLSRLKDRIAKLALLLSFW